MIKSELVQHILAYSIYVLLTLIADLANASLDPRLRTA